MTGREDLVSRVFVQLADGGGGLRLMGASKRQSAAEQRRRRVVGGTVDVDAVVARRAQHEPTAGLVSPPDRRNESFGPSAERGDIVRLSEQAGTGRRQVRLRTKQDRRAAAHTSDAALLAQVRNGEDEAFGELYERHLGAARGAARALVASHAEADDV